ncbi:MAG: hypothetical protein HC879_21110 [Leptolyngbyaceae cyanobacterium SL_5_9]|nr:hypothetical protein [Leptolyngbyaceae cyanobacterium SL_5_9]NJO76725.1 hypothetical protein [Leptolyngbyaceae cyanobacterium RM1_406_9]
MSSALEEGNLHDGLAVLGLAIALTAYARDFDQQKAFQVGFQAHITKPVEPEALVEAIAMLLR